MKAYGIGRNRDEDSLKNAIAVHSKAFARTAKKLRRKARRVVKNEIRGFVARQNFN